MNLYEHYFEFLNPFQAFECQKELDEGGWKFSARSNENDYTFFYMPLLDNKFFTGEFFEVIKQKIGKNYVIDRVHANGQTYGLCGSLHTDNTDDDCYTFLYYANPYWDVQWGGGTAFYSAMESQHVPYIPNSAILFKSNILHVGLEPTRHCRELRKTVSFQLRRI